MEYIIFTELLDRKDDLPIVGSVDYESFAPRYELKFESQVFVNDVGRWRFRIFKFKGQEELMLATDIISVRY